MKTGHKRVYIKHNAYYFVDRGYKWHRLCALEDGEAKMLRELAKRKDAPLARPGSIDDVVLVWTEKKLSKYAASTRADYSLMLPKIRMGFLGFDAAEVTPKHVQDFIDQWADKPRQANKYRHLLSMLFKYACAPLGLRRDNPCDQTDTFKTTSRDRYIDDAEFYRIRRGALHGKDERRNASGPIIVCAIDLAYLTFQRQGEVRRLKWADMDDEWLYFKPAKTESTTGAKIRWKRTPEINAVLERARLFSKPKSKRAVPSAEVKSVYVIHTLKGGAYTKAGLYTAWERACTRAKVENAHFHDLRAKALTDAEEAGYTMEQIQLGATHATSEMTRKYIRRRQAVSSAVEMAMPEEAA